MSIQSPSSSDSSSISSVIDGLKKNVDELAGFFSKNDLRSKVYDFKDPEAIKTREALRQKVSDIQSRINELKEKPQFASKSEMTSDEVRSFNQLKRWVQQVDSEISTLDEQIKEKTSTPGWIRVLCFWRTFKEEETPVPRLVSKDIDDIMTEARKSYLTGIIEEETRLSIEDRVKDLGISGMWALGKKKEDGALQLYLSGERDVAKVDIEVTSTGYKVENRVFSTLNEVLESKHATSKLKETETKEIASRIEQNQKELKAESPRSEEDAERFMNSAKRLLGENPGRYTFAKTSDPNRFMLIVEGSGGAVSKREIRITERGKIRYDDKEYQNLSQIGLKSEKNVKEQLVKETPRLVEEAKMAVGEKVGALIAADKESSQTDLLVDLQDGLQAGSIGAAFVVEAKDKSLSLVFIDQDQEIKTGKLELFYDKVVLTVDSQTREFSSVDALSKELKLQKLSDVTERLEQVKQHIAKAKADIEASVPSKTTSSQQAAKTRELEKIVSGLRKEAIGTAFLVSGANKEQYLVFVDSDLSCKSRRIEVQADKVILTDGREVREFASFEALKAELKFKDFGAMDQVHRAKLAKIANVQAALSSMSVLPKGVTIGSQEKARTILHEAVSYLGDRADKAYVIFEEKGNMHLAYVQGKEINVRLLDLSSTPGTCFVFGADGKQVPLLDNVPEGAMTHDVTKTLRERLQKAAAAAGYDLAIENSWTQEVETAKRLRSQLLTEAGSLQDNLGKTANEFAELLGNLGLDTNIGAYAVSNAIRDGLVAIDVVAGDPPKVERLLVDVAVQPGKFVVGERVYDSVQDLVSGCKLTKKMAALRKDREVQVAKSRELLGQTKDFAVKVSSTQEAEKALAPLVDTLKSSGVTGGYLFRAPNGTSTQQASFLKGALTTAASYAGANYLTYAWQRWGWGTPSAEFVISVYRPLEGGKLGIEDYKVPLELGELKYGGKKYKTLPDVMEAIKAEKGIKDIEGITQLREMKSRIDSHKTGIEKDKGFTANVGKTWQATKGLAWGVSALASYIPKVGEYVPKVYASPIAPTGQIDAEQNLTDVFGLVPEETYMIYQLPENKYYCLSVIKNDGSKGYFEIDVLSQPGKCVVRTKEGKEIASKDTLSEALQAAVGEAKPFVTQWYAYKAQEGLRDKPLALEGPVSTAVETKSAATEDNQGITNLRNLLSIAKEKSPPKEKERKELWLAIKDVNEVKDEKTVKTQSRKLLRAIFGHSANSRLEQISKDYKQLVPLIHPDKSKEPDATDLFALLGRLYTNAELKA